MHVCVCVRACLHACADVYVQFISIASPSLSDNCPAMPVFTIIEDQNSEQINPDSTMEYDDILDTEGFDHSMSDESFQTGDISGTCRNNQFLLSNRS